MYILVDKKTRKILDFSDLELFACEGRFVVEVGIDDVANMKMVKLFLSKN